MEPQWHFTNKRQNSSVRAFCVMCWFGDSKCMGTVGKALMPNSERCLSILKSQIGASILQCSSSPLKRLGMHIGHALAVSRSTSSNSARQHKRPVLARIQQVLTCWVIRLLTHHGNGKILSDTYYLTCADHPFHHSSYCCKQDGFLHLFVENNQQKKNHWSKHTLFSSRSFSIDRQFCCLF